MVDVKNTRRPSPLQRRVLIVLAALDAKRPGPVATRDIERVLEQGGDAPVYGPNLRASCRRMEAAGWLRTLRAPNLQLAVELTDAAVRWPPRFSLTNRRAPGGAARDNGPGSAPDPARPGRRGSRPAGGAGRHLAPGVPGATTSSASTGPPVSSCGARPGR